jgi:hypothetical protein
MLLCLLLDRASDAVFDTLLEAVHACTPLISVPVRGRIFCGRDDMRGLHEVVRTFGCRAAMAPRRSDALLRACSAAVPGRIDAFDHADDVSTTMLSMIPELGLTDDDVERLRLFGLDSIGRLRTLQHRHIQLQFGERAGRLYRLLHEAEVAPLPMYVPAPQVIVIERFDDDVREPGIILDTAQRCTARAVLQLGTRQTWRIELAVLDAAERIVDTRSRILRQGATLLRTLWVHVQALCRELLHADRYWRGIRLRLASLRQAEGQQMDLFGTEISRTDLLEQMRPRYGSVLKQIEILDPWTLITERHARIVPIRPADDTQKGDRT